MQFLDGFLWRAELARTVRLSAERLGRIDELVGGEA